MIKLEELTLKKVALELKDKYPDSRMSSNLEGSFDFLEDNAHYILEQLEELFSYEILDMCGYRNHIIVIAEIIKYLQIIYDYGVGVDNDISNVSDIKSEQLNKEFDVSYISSHPLLAYMAYSLDGKGLTEHGSSINGVWITDIGVYCLFVYRQYLKEDDVDENTLEYDLKHTPIAFMYNEKASRFFGICNRCHQSVNESDDNPTCHICGHKLIWKNTISNKEEL